MIINLISKTIVLFIVALIYLRLLPFQIFADWNTHPNNPILSNDNPVSWFVSQIQNPVVLFENNIYKMWFTGATRFSRWNIGFASSSAETTNWRVFENPVISQSGDWERDINAVSVHNNIENYQMWYNTGQINWISGSDRFRLGYATSSAELVWLKSQHVLFGDINSWDSGGADRGLSVIKHDGVYHLWYTATNDNDLRYDPYWHIGYATSSSGLVWTKHPNNPVIQKSETWEFDNIMYPFVLYEGGKFKMWYGSGAGDSCSRYVYAESTNGYDWTKPADKNPVYVVSNSNNKQIFDDKAISGHTFIRDGDMYKIWYSGFDAVQWSIGYATMSADPIVNPTPIPSPTPTPIEPVIIVPGMMASWNKEAILEGQLNPSTKWKLLPFMKEYEGLKDTLINLGYEEGKSLFIWPYDWRKPINELSNNLHTFIQSVVVLENPDSKIHLVGHSLGGLISETWSLSGTHSGSLHHIVTIAAPHKGIIQPYKAWSGGDIHQGNSFLSLATKLVIELNRRSFSTTKALVQDLFPVLRDLLPTEPYLKKQSDNTLIPKSSMHVWNDFLTSQNVSINSLFPFLDVIYGTLSQSPSYYVVSQPSWLETKLGLWQDGKPVSTLLEDGDNTITSSRSYFSEDPSFPFPTSHNEIVGNQDTIKKVLEILEIPYSDSAVSDSSSTIIEPSLLFLLRSPATLEVKKDGTTYEDFDGIIFIPNASSGLYEATVKGIGNGSYRLAVGQFTPTQYLWNEYKNTASTGSQTTFVIDYSSQSPKIDPVTNLSDEERIKEIDTRLIDLSQSISSPWIVKSRFHIKTALFNLQKKHHTQVKKHLEQILVNLSHLRKQKKAEDVLNRTLLVSDTLINSYSAIFSNKLSYISDKSINILMKTTEKEQKIAEKKLLKYKKGDASYKYLLLQEAILTRKQAMFTSEKARKTILLFQTHLLLKEI